MSVRTSPLKAGVLAGDLRPRMELGRMLEKVHGLLNTRTLLIPLIGAIWSLIVGT